MAKSSDTKSTTTYSKSFTGSLTDPSGNVRHFIQGACCRNFDLPAVEYADGTRIWYKENPKRGEGFGQRSEIQHRVGGASAIYINGVEHWMQNGVFHRDDGEPAFISKTIKKWYVNGKFIKMELVK
ncbi:MAG: hypothetical protein Q7R66_10985 [Undibacterium sp.]|uniref:hypothetical protein n=1 Tax=Undibacterium sp. TaxID=1914977 RepID=UPI00271FF927|nr:hypothetical protein [Undibacterium sp.]MDO8652706.1 hypothetical protein [Undibacterium sp.]